MSEERGEYEVGRPETRRFIMVRVFIGAFLSSVGIAAVVEAFSARSPEVPEVAVGCLMLFIGIPVFLKGTLEYLKAPSRINRTPAAKRTIMWCAISLGAIIIFVAGILVVKNWTPRPLPEGKQFDSSLDGYKKDSRRMTKEEAAKFLDSEQPAPK